MVVGVKLKHPGVRIGSNMYGTLLERVRYAVEPSDQMIRVRVVQGDVVGAGLTLTADMSWRASRMFRYYTWAYIYR